MNKKEAVFTMLGMLRGFIECNESYRTVKVGEFLGEKYNKYELIMSDSDTTIALIDAKAPKVGNIRKRIIEINKEFEIEQIVELIMVGLAYDVKNNHS